MIMVILAVLSFFEMENLTVNAQTEFANDDAELGKPSKGKKRYLPEKAWAALSPAEKAATNKAKASGNKRGKQFVKQPKSIAKKTSKYR